ncbi:phosphatase PAP2 family protein [Nocardia salmonicida]|uniref:phosphatase PAP2 family protein n=1 Tax=Nocardia salmonicida TaxID=53431 RepID=UPI003CF9BA9A
MEGQCPYRRECGNDGPAGVDPSPWFLAALPLTVVNGWSRVWLGDHTRGQVVVGSIVGAALAAGAYLLAS